VRSLRNRSKRCEIRSNAVARTPCIIDVVWAMQNSEGLKSVAVKHCLAPEPLGQAGRYSPAAFEVLVKATDRTLSASEMCIAEGPLCV
jgi:hypothetical protein